MNPLLVSYLTTLSSNECNMQASNDSADSNSARHGENQEKEKKLRLMN